MPQSLGLPGVKLDDVLLRLEDSERQVCALVSANSGGWGNVIAWNPIETFLPKSYDADSNLLELEAFVTEQRSRSRLIIGYLSYDFGCDLHGVTLQTATDMTMPRIVVNSFDNWIDFNEAGAAIESSDNKFIESTAALLKRSPRILSKRIYVNPLKATLDRHDYHDAYQKIEAYIKAGDAYQVNLARWLKGTTNNSGRDLFSALSRSSQSNFQAYLEVANVEILSYSPERFIQVQDRSITTMPIKGTRPRGSTPKKDEMLKSELLNSPKEKAELNMITDLMRNDLGKICEVGSVKVSELRTLEAYPNLWHAHSKIDGKLRADISSIGALASALPGGSITGCPKKRAMEIINELESDRRGAYTGSIFTIKSNGELDSNIVIRTIFKKASRLLIPVGGGIVYDSTEISEFQELLDKAASFVGDGLLGKDI